MGQDDDLFESLRLELRRGSLILAVLGAGCTPTAIDPRVPLKIEPSMKTVQTGPASYELHMASRTLVPLSGQGPKVRLVVE